MFANFLAVKPMSVRVKSQTFFGTAESSEFSVTRLLISFKQRLVIAEPGVSDGSGRKLLECTQM